MKKLLIKCKSKITTTGKRAGKNELKSVGKLRELLKEPKDARITRRNLLRVTDKRR